MDNQLVCDIEQLLREVSILVQRKEREILHEYLLTSPQYSVLLVLAQHGDLTIGELSEKCCLACSTMTDLVDRMEKNGLVKRVRDERDRRVVRIHVLAHGEELIAVVMKERQRYLSDVFTYLSEDQVRIFKQQLSIVCERMKEPEM